MIQVVHLEDDGPLREILQAALMAAEPNITLRQFINSDEAVSYITAHAQDIDLFILDIRVPGSMNGLQVAEKIRELKSPAPIIITSAYQKPSSEFLSTLECRWYPKPWHLIDVTRELLSIAFEHYRRELKLL